MIHYSSAKNRTATINENVKHFLKNEAGDMRRDMNQSIKLLNPDKNIAVNIKLEFERKCLEFTEKLKTGNSIEVGEIELFDPSKLFGSMDEFLTAANSSAIYKKNFFNDWLISVYDNSEQKINGKDNTLRESAENDLKNILSCMFNFYLNCDDKVVRNSKNNIFSQSSNLLYDIYIDNRSLKSSKNFKLDVKDKVANFIVNLSHHLSVKKHKDCSRDYEQILRIIDVNDNKISSSIVNSFSALCQKDKDAFLNAFVGDGDSDANSFAVMVSLNDVELFSMDCKFVENILEKILKINKNLTQDDKFRIIKKFSSLEVDAVKILLLSKNFLDENHFYKLFQVNDFKDYLFYHISDLVKMRASYKDLFNKFNSLNDDKLSIRLAEFLVESCEDDKNLLLMTLYENNLETAKLLLKNSEAAKVIIKSLNDPELKVNKNLGDFLLNLCGPDFIEEALKISPSLKKSEVGKALLLKNKINKAIQSNISKTTISPGKKF